MNSRIPLTLKSLTSRVKINRMTVYSATAVILGSAGFYEYHSTQPTAKVIASENNQNEVASYSENELFHDHASSANNNRIFSRITIPSGKASVINYNPIEQQNDLHHILITVQGEGEIQYAPSQKTKNQQVNNDKIIYGTNNNEIIHKQLKLGNSVGVPSTDWHQIVNKHDSQDLILIVTSLPTNQVSEE